jgi:glucosamine-6-phosphate deaminase
MGQAVAAEVAGLMRFLLARQDVVRMVFASAASQHEFLAALVREPNLDWRRVVAFHLDEYVGLSPDVPQSFAWFLNDRLFGKVKPGVTHFFNGLAPDLEAECRRYAALYDAAPIDIMCNGIGENGHMAFNDPPYADFADPLTAKVVTLDERSRQQQVHDGFFPTIDDVPRQALTLTIPAIVRAHSIHCIVPGAAKAEAVRDTLLGPVTESCPATILRRHPAAVLYLDPNSAALWQAAP